MIFSIVFVLVIVPIACQWGSWRGLGNEGIGEELAIASLLQAYCNGALFFCLFFGASCRVRTTDRCVSRDSILPIKARVNLNQAQRIIWVVIGK